MKGYVILTMVYFNDVLLETISRSANADEVAAIMHKDKNSLEKEK